GDHVVDRVSAGTADAENGNARLHLANAGDRQIAGHVCLIIARAAGPAPRRSPQSNCKPPKWAGPPPAIRGSVEEGSEAFAQPSSDPCHVTARSCHQLPRSPRLEVLKMGRLWVHKQSGRNRKGRTLCRFRQTGQAERAANSYRPPQDAGGEIGEPGELARPASQHHAPARLGRERRSSKAVAHHLQDLLDPWTDDAHERGARDELRRLTLVVLDRRYRDHVSFIRSTGQNTAINRFDSL